MGKVDNLIGMKFGRYLVVERIGARLHTKSGHVYWRCMCECGNEREVAGYHLKSGLSKSCGCYHDDMKIINSTTHGMTGTKIYNRWVYIRDRCNNKKHLEYRNYGGRGIKVCEDWESSFECFMEWALKNGYSDNLEIDRIDNDKGYDPGNCRFVTHVENCNNRRNTYYVEIDGIRKSVSDWSRESGVLSETIRDRYERGIRGVELLRPTRAMMKKILMLEQAMYEGA